MSYSLAYTTRFHSLDDTLWDIDIYIEGYDARPVEIKLEGDAPCVIEWQETGKTDVVQSSKCTLRVSNESDRQMVQLMNRPSAAILVSRDGKGYWMGYIDDAVYEEPYSFAKAYVTELTFTDFGTLNRVPFTLKGKQSVMHIVRDCLESTAFGNAPHINLHISLLEPKTQQPINLDMLYINADRFEADGDSWDAMTTKREVLEEVLRPLGLRIMQKYAQVYIYDIDWLRDHADALANHPVWKGTDAYLRGSETYGWFEVAFEHDAEDTLATDGLDYDHSGIAMQPTVFALVHDGDAYPFSYLVGFYVAVKRILDTVANVSLGNHARFFRTEGVLSDSSDIGVAWRIDANQGYVVDGSTIHVAPNTISAMTLVANIPAVSIAATRKVFDMTTGYLPLAPDRDRYQLRVNLDFLLSFRGNPFEEPFGDQTWETYWTLENFAVLMVPVKLEVLDDDGHAVCHYRNATATDRTILSFPNNPVALVEPLGIDRGEWASGPASFGDMFLAYYKDYDPDDDDRDPLVANGWVGNRIAWANTGALVSLYNVRDDGEYLPLPPMAGRLRLTVGSGVMKPNITDDQFWVFVLGREHFRWQLYRNPQITLARANRRNDEIDTEPAYERYCYQTDADHFSETVQAGTWQKGIAPSARGLLFDGAGNVWQTFTKNGRDATLQQHRLRCIADQTASVQPVITGTAELDPLFRAKREGSTPGVFLVTALRQDLHQGTEELTMARIANAGGFVHEFAWSEPVCVEQEEPYRFEWSSPVCATEPGPYKFTWGSPVCVKQYVYYLEWEEMAVDS